MAHSLSAQKRDRQNAKRRAANRSRTSALKSQLRRCMDAISSGDSESAQKMLREACALLDREANRGLIHRNEAARRKSRMTARVSNMKKAAK
ncbi:MAG: 30S ribosomal protein S20 [Phycisphaerales bacterium]|nr:30S ribosomal protein S20 [Phycisphaerales bacterium]